jgi:hypothetical protein
VSSVVAIGAGRWCPQLVASACRPCPLVRPGLLPSTWPYARAWRRFLLLLLFPRHLKYALPLCFFHLYVVVCARVQATKMLST